MDIIRTLEQTEWLFDRIYERIITVLPFTKPDLRIEKLEVGNLGRAFANNYGNNYIILDTNNCVYAEHNNFKQLIIHELVHVLTVEHHVLVMEDLIELDESFMEFIIDTFIVPLLMKLCEDI